MDVCKQSVPSHACTDLNYQLAIANEIASMHALIRCLATAGMPYIESIIVNLH